MLARAIRPAILDKFSFGQEHGMITLIEKTSIMISLRADLEGRLERQFCLDIWDGQLVWHLDLGLSEDLSDMNFQYEADCLSDWATEGEFLSCNGIAMQ